MLPGEKCTKLFNVEQELISLKSDLAVLNTVINVVELYEIKTHSLGLAVVASSGWLAVTAWVKPATFSASTGFIGCV